MRKIICLIAFLSLSNLFAEAITLYTGTSGGTYQKLGVAFSRICPALNIQVFETKGSRRNIGALLSSGSQAIAFVQSDVLKSIDKRSGQKLRVLQKLYSEEIHLISSSQVSNFANLRDKRVGVGVNGSGTYFTANNIKAQTSMKWKTILIGPEQSVEAVRSGLIDAAFLVVGSPAEMLQSRNLNNKIKLVNITHRNLAKFYKRGKIKASTYRWLKKNVYTYLVESVLVANDHLKKGKADALHSCLKKNKSQLIKVHKKWREATK